MVSLDKAAIALTMAIVAIALGVAASGGAAQDAGPAVPTPTVSTPTVSTETSEPKTSESFGADLAAKVREDAGKVEEEMMEEPAKQTVEIEEEVIMEEGTTMEESAGPQTVHVEIPVGTAVPGCEETNSCFTPADVTINAGDTVHWMNVDTAAHTVTGGSPADGPSGIFDSSLVMADAVYAFTFDDTGSYDYFCMVHPWMTGTVTVN